MKQILPPLLALFSLSCLPATAVERPNILLIFTDGSKKKRLRHWQTVFMPVCNSAAIS